MGLAALSQLLPVSEAASQTRQIDVHSLLNARVVTTLTGNKLITWNKGFDV